MSLQIIKDSYGNEGVFIPMTDWEEIVIKHEDLKDLVQPKTKIKLSDLEGSISSVTSEAMLKHIEEGRKQWNKRLVKMQKSLLKK